MVNKVLSANYLLNFQDEKKSKDIFRLAHETILGHNINEILLVDKSENKGFFEKFLIFSVEPYFIVTLVVFRFFTLSINVLS